MMISTLESFYGDAMLAYSIITVGAAPYVSQVAMSGIRWIVFLPFIGIPAYIALTLLGTMSQRGPVLTFRRMTPIAAGIGWAMTWHIAERLFSIQLRAAQTLTILIEIIFRPSFDWATKCGHSYNSEFCVDFDSVANTTTTDYHHYPDNFWPAQEFNRYHLRGNEPLTKIPDVWEPNEWYLGHSTDTFELSLPTLRLIIPHVIIWSVLILLFSRFSQYTEKVISLVCHKVPLILYSISTIGLTTFGLHFTPTIIDMPVSDKKVTDDPIDFFADVRGVFRTFLVTLDYSSIFTGLILFASSRVRTGEIKLHAWMIVALLTILPSQLFILNRGCQSTVNEVQPAFRIYETTDETMTFNLMPVCFAAIPFGYVWALFYYSAHFLYTCVGPMVVYFSFIQQSFLDDFPALHNATATFSYVVGAIFSVAGLVLFTPQGTKIVALLRYMEESSFTQIAAFITIALIYGWQNLERDALKYSHSFGKYTFLVIIPLLTVVPMVISTKFVAVYDLLISGNDVVKHINIGTKFIPLPGWIARSIGYGALFAPCIIISLFAVYSIYDLRHRNRLPWGDLFRPTAELYSHQNIVSPERTPIPTAYILIKKIMNIPLSYAMSILIITEATFAILICLAFFMNSTPLIGSIYDRTRNDYRTAMLLTFLVLHVISLFEMQKAQVKNERPSRLNLYVGVAVMETAMLNAYMIMYATDHTWGMDLMPFLIILANTGSRGMMVAIALALKERMIRSQAERGPSRARDVVEADVEGEDESPIVFELARA